jgi:hypothetical protein
MPAKKAAKKAAKTAADSPEAEKKAVKKVAKKAAKKTAAPKKATASKKTAAPGEPVNVELSAYLNYRSRIESGFHGDELGDWLAAENAPEA